MVNQIITPPSTQINKRVVGLDLMRISMALLIFMFHSRIHVLKCSYGFLNYFVDMGAISMTGFFLLSGYVINLTYGRKDMTSPKEFKRFYLKRLIAIIPLYFTYASLLVLANILVNGKSAIMEELVLFPIEVLGIQSVFSSLFSFSHNGGSWFISCILICYFIYPLLQNITKDLNNRNRTMVVIVLSIVLLWSPFVQQYFHLQTIYSNPFFRSLEFTIGTLVSQLNDSLCTNKFISFIRKPLVCCISLVGLVVGVSLAMMIGIPGDYMLYSWVALPCFVSLMISLGSYDFKKLQSSKIVKYLSELSFCIFLGQVVYVWYAVHFTFKYVGIESNIMKITVSFIIVFCIANVLHYLVEIPSSKLLKQRLFSNK